MHLGAGGGDWKESNHAGEREKKKQETIVLYIVVWVTTVSYSRSTYLRAAEKGMEIARHRAREGGTVPQKYNIL